MNEEWLKEAERLADAYAKRRATVTQLLVVNSENGLAQFARVSEDVARSALMSHLARAAVPAVQPPEFREVSWGVNSTMRPCKGMAVSEYAFRQWAEANGIALAAPQVEARQEPKPNTCKLTECRGKPRCEPCLLMDSSYPAQPSGEAATARDAARYRWLRDVASHEWLATGPITDASVDAALSSTPAQGDAASVPASDNWQQYAKAGETALACIERHRREQDGLMKLLAHARGEPLPDHEIIALLPAGWTGMLAQVMEFARRIERTRGVLASLNDQQEKPT